MTKPVEPKSIERKTGTSWSDWMAWLNAAGAKDWSHPKIARFVRQRFDDPWWAQQITICYEEQTGRRRPGQRDDGSFSFSTSKTFNVPRRDLLGHWIEYCQNTAEIAQTLGADSRRSDTPNRSNWRVTLKDGIKFAASAEPRGESRAALVLSEDAIPSEAQKNSDRQFWKSRLAKFATVLP